MERIMNMESDVNLLSPLTLAYMGDCVFELLVREMIIQQGNRPVNELHQKSVSFVKCDAQAKFLDRIYPLLTDKEIQIYKRGRNAKTSVPKNASSADYHKATGFESLFGYLYLSGDIKRVNELYSACIEGA